MTKNRLILVRHYSMQLKDTLMNRLQQYFLSVLSFLSTALICAGVLASDVDAPVEFKTNIPEIGESKQMILVTTDGWNVVPARLSCFERAGAKSEWRQVFAPSDAVVGENGLAWGIGLHGTRPTDGPVKHEGDGRAPAGVFLLHEAFGYAAAGDAKITSFPYTAITPTTEGVDDVNSRYYNRVIDSATISDKDWRSSEIMLRQDGLYRWGVVVEHNWKPFPGFGSCIFLHIWEGANQGTAGCTAMPADTVEKIIRWVDETKRPVFVQLPKEIYIRVKDQWSLP